MGFTSTTRLFWWTPAIKPYVKDRLPSSLQFSNFVQIRRDPRINWIVNPVHKRREARGLTSIGKQVCAPYLVDVLSKISHRIVVWAKVIVTITPLLAPPGKNTTRLAFVATDNVFPPFTLHVYRHVASCTCMQLEQSIIRRGCRKPERSSWKYIWSIM